MNKVILMGRLTKDPEIRYSSSAEALAVAKYTLAVNRRFKRDSEPDADFIPCTAFGKSAEFAERFLKKGMQILISGRIQVRSWDDAQSGQKRWGTDVIVEEQEFTESKAAFESRAASNPSFNMPADAGPPMSAPQNSAPDGFISGGIESVNDDDLPF